MMKLPTKLTAVVENEAKEQYTFAREHSEQLEQRLE
jgi:hypothetical protein